MYREQIEPSVLWGCHNKAFICHHYPCSNDFYNTMCVCMCVCVDMCAVCMCVLVCCVYACVCVCVCVCMHVCACVYVLVCVYVCARTCMRVCVSYACSAIICAAYTFLWMQLMNVIRHTVHRAYNYMLMVLIN